MSRCPICPKCASELDVDVLRVNSEIWVCPECGEKVMLKKVRHGYWVDGDCWI